MKIARFLPMLWARLTLAGSLLATPALAEPLRVVLAEYPPLQLAGAGWPGGGNRG